MLEIQINKVLRSTQNTKKKVPNTALVIYDWDQQILNISNKSMKDVCLNFSCCFTTRISLSKHIKIPIVNFSFLSNSISSSPLYNICISELIPYVCKFHTDIINKYVLLPKITASIEFWGKHNWNQHSTNSIVITAKLLTDTNYLCCNSLK